MYTVHSQRLVAGIQSSDKNFNDSLLRSPGGVSVASNNFKSPNMEERHLSLEPKGIISQYDFRFMLTTLLS